MCFLFYTRTKLYVELSWNMTMIYKKKMGGSKYTCCWDRGFLPQVIYSCIMCLWLRYVILDKICSWLR